MIPFTVSIEDEKYEQIKDMACEAKVNKQVIVRKLIQFGFAWIAQEQLKQEGK